MSVGVVDAHGVYGLLDDLIGRGSDVDDRALLVVAELLERVELRVQQRGGHEVLGAQLHPLLQDRERRLEVHEEGRRRIAEHVAVGPLQCGAGDDGRRTFVVLDRDQLRDRLEPRPAVLVGQRDALLHLLDVLAGVQGVALDELAVQLVGQLFADGGLPGPRDPHHHDMHRLATHAPYPTTSRYPRGEPTDGRSPMTILVSERVGQFFVDGDRLEYTEYGSGDQWVVLLHGQLMPRRMHQPLARAIATEGFHVVTLDLLGHGRSDRPLDPKGYSMTAFGEQVIALLDHLGADQAVIGGTSLGSNVSLEVADVAPERVRGLLLEMPVLDNALEAGLIAFGQLMFLARFVPVSITATRRLARLVPPGGVPFWPGIWLDTLNQQPAAMAAAIHGIFFGRIAPSSKRRRQIQAPALVIGHPRDPIHPAADAAMLAEEMPNARFVAARSILEWRSRPERLNAEAIEFVASCWGPEPGRRASGS